VFHHLGSVEMEDQISVTKELTRQFSFIDPARVGIWGWSYGGYATLKILARDAGE
jgi:dipeptidyl aminopeptidase/acylaminoacyl peptidase